MTCWINASKLHTINTGLVFSRDGGTVAGLHLKVDNQIGYHWADDSSSYGF